MGDDPFVCAEKQLLLVSGVPVLLREIQIGSLRKNNDHTETALLGVAGRIMQGVGKNLHSRSGGNQERLHICGIILEILGDIRPFSKHQHQIADCHIDLGRTMVLQRIQKLVLSVAVTDLYRHLAVGTFHQLVENRKRLQLRNRSHIDHILGTGSLFHLLDQLFEINIFYHTAVFFESCVRDRNQVHEKIPPLHLV